MSVPSAGVVKVTHVPLRSSVMALGAGVVWSLGVPAARLAGDADAWQYLIWRSVAIIAVIELLNARRGVGGKLREAFTSGTVMLVACVSLLVASLGFVYAVKHTTAANASFLASMAPLATSLVARVVLRERMTRVTIAAVALGLLGVTIMITGDLGVGSMQGNIAAVISAVGFAGYAVCVRTAPARDWSAVMPGYAAMMIVLCTVVTIVNGRSLLLPADDTAYAMVHGGVIIVVGTLLFNAAAGRIPAVAMTVFAQTEMVFAPIWVFLRFGEEPTVRTLVGGAVIVGAVVGKALLDARSSRAAPVELAVVVA